MRLLWIRGGNDRVLAMALGTSLPGVVERATVVLNNGVFADIGLSERECEQLFRLLRKVRGRSPNY